MDKQNHSTTSSSNSVNSAVNSHGQSSFGGSGMVDNTSTSYGSAISGLYISGPDQINWDSMKYYVITQDRNSPDIDFKKMSENNVGGVIIEAGYLFNAAHVKQYYRNPKIDTQCKAASAANMPFGLYAISKARSETEAREELYELSFCIRKYPPMIGMWIEFNLAKSKSQNDKIVEYYKKELTRLGLKDSIGIMANTTELKNISWSDKHYKDWSLWLVDHVDSVSTIEALLTPDLFVVE